MIEIQKLYAFLAVNETSHLGDGPGEGAMSLGPHPMVVSDPRLVELFMPMAIAVAKETGVEIRLVEFIRNPDFKVIK